ncbi:hypothetical protein G6M87_10425 [Rhizobium rhizogenes]|uniref:hypothetical protein n=1 Tax=Rhizobium rhizogenes TaxID=359 RepID=UPI0015727479|nr:hypothetical protein [Rhizobium rhizogenes]NTI22271.1 hypothetical protein [Rhizobium rhizogenes]QTG05863.1 hypothetical protein G6M87_10425 [Rhizobium rhizogenes]
MIYPDVTRWPPIPGGFRHRYGIPGIIARLPAPIRIVRGYRGRDGRFEIDGLSDQWLAFAQRNDVILWNLASGQFATWNGRAFALGEDQIGDAATCALDHCLNIFADPMTWLRASCDGIVVTDWTQAFDRLRDVSRVAVDADILQRYHKAMVPKRLPRVFVISKSRAAA